MVFHGQRILRAGKLTEKVLRLFIATGKDEVISLVKALNIQHDLTPVLPTSELVLRFYAIRIVAIPVVTNDSFLTFEYL